jgi:glycosyltransferase involved in cell wall biosynthesis
VEILLLNWRCTRNPKSGGAETYCFHIGTRLVRDYGCKITWVSPLVEGAPREEMIDGIRFVRIGGWPGIYLRGNRLAKSRAGEFDLILDSCNTIPFFTHAMSKSVLLHYQLAADVWLSELSVLGYPLRCLERKVLPLYRHKPTITISDSSRRDLEALGFTNVGVVEPAIAPPREEGLPAREAVSTVCYIGRLKRNKRPEHAIRAFALIRHACPSARLWIVGRGDDEVRLRRLVAALGLAACTRFWGYVSETEKFSLLARAHVILVPSVREGWGIVVIEANHVGTPAVCYDVPGLRDSTRHMETGILVENGNVQQMAAMALKILQDGDLARRLQARAAEWARGFTWDQAAAGFHRLLKQAG